MAKSHRLCSLKAVAAVASYETMITALAGFGTILAPATFGAVAAVFAVVAPKIDFDTVDP